MGTEATSLCSSDDGCSPQRFASGGGGTLSRQQVPVAVVGMGCRLPGHNNSPTALWSFLQQGGVAINKPPESRFKLEGHHDSHRRPGTMKTPGGMFLEDVDPAVFDGQFFSISRADCIAMDPQQRQMLEVTYECLENAGVTLEAVKGKPIGCIIGTNIIDYGGMQNRDPEDRPDSATIGVASSILSNRVSHFLDITGPSMTLDTACSASLVAVDVACRYLDTYQADGMIVGGANMWLGPEHNEETGMMRMTQSVSGKCHSFDAKADGYVKAEGVNAVYLKRLADAIRDGDPIRAIIRGTATNSGGRTPGLASPSPEAQAAAIRTAYRNAGIKDFNLTAFLECHGTGTLAGDPIEVQGIASVFAPSRAAGRELVIGSIKSNIGHSEAAAGLSGLIKAVLAVESGVIPGNPTFLTPNPKIDFASSRVRATRLPVRWPGSFSQVRRASVNSFGFGGANAHAVIENVTRSPHISSYQKISNEFFADDSESDDEEQSALDFKILVFSANDSYSLRTYIKRLSNHLSDPSVSVETSHIAYTLAEKRSRHYHRAFSIQEKPKVRAISNDSLVFGKLASDPPRVGFVFTGQGAQWSQMGLDLLNTFPRARQVIQQLDAVLQSIPDPPTWSLLRELTEPRDVEALRQPEYSQPLVTALQLAILAVTRDCGIYPVAVVGHSSGEIAAATAAGLITHQEAILAAYYRGQAAKNLTIAEPMGMLAVGIGTDTIKPFLEPEQDLVQIACFNSPKSLTLSGPRTALIRLQDRLKEQKHFARLLRVNVAYHSSYMADIGRAYEIMLADAMGKNDILSDLGKEKAIMFSSVTGKILDTTPGESYWRQNMVSPVRFEQATAELLRHQDGADFLVEIGPSNALAGPVAQIRQSLSDKTNSSMPYCSVLKRGTRSLEPLYITAGYLYLLGGDVDLFRVNRLHETKNPPSVLIDLPNYAWNHSSKYWHETQASRDWRFKNFINHDLLGSKVLGTPWQSPIFKKTLKLANLSWLRDHRLGSQIVFPGAGYIAMAVEAMYQTAVMTQWRDIGPEPEHYRFRLRDIRFSRLLLLSEDAEMRYTLALSPVRGGSIRQWYEFRVRSLQSDDEYIEHSSGQISVETDYHDDKRATPDMIRPLDLPVPAQPFYKAMSDSGFWYGPCFRKHLMVETIMGQRHSRSILSLEPPPSKYGQSYYPIHPACLDGAFHTTAPAMWKGDLPSAGNTMVPHSISSMVIPATSRAKQHEEIGKEAIAIASARFFGIGNREDPRNYGTSCSVFDAENGSLYLEMKDLTIAPINVTEHEPATHTFTRLLWAADIDMLLRTPNLHQNLQHLMENTEDTITMSQLVLDLIAHKRPTLRVLEWNLSASNCVSLWLQTASSTRQACGQYQFSSHDPTILVETQNRYALNCPLNSHFKLLDDSSANDNERFDLIIVNFEYFPTGGVWDSSISSIHTKAADNGFVLWLGRKPTIQGMRTTLLEEGLYLAYRTDMRLDSPECNGIEKIPVSRKRRYSSLPGDPTSHNPSEKHRILENYHRENVRSRQNNNVVTVLSLLENNMHIPNQLLTNIEDQIGYRLALCEKIESFLNSLSRGSIVLILDELFGHVIDQITNPQWEHLKLLVQHECKILWVTSGSQLNVSDPRRAAIHGLFRTIRAEEPLSRLLTLDVECPSNSTTPSAIAACLRELTHQDPAEIAMLPFVLDTEYLELKGILHISRVVIDKSATALQNGEVPKPNPMVDLHGHRPTLQLGAERVGNADTLIWAETAPDPSQLAPGMVEVEIYAAGLNYKDVVVVMGIVPGDERMLGGEAAGVVRRVSPEITEFAVGDRVVLFSKGAFASRLQTTPGRVHRIPDTMSFEEAATMSAVFLTCIHSLLGLANLTAEKSVLIHSAAGGVGIAAIQLAQYVGAEVFATVGNDEKRAFIRSRFGLADDHIYNSRTPDFADQIIMKTGGRGVDVVLNSLTGDMLDASFRILADGGTMVELGKKDILDRSSLPMEPFDRNISFRAVDMSHERAPDQLVSRLMMTLFELVEAGHVKPITPMHIFSFNEVPSAIRLLRSGKHMGKVVLSDGPEAKVDVRIRQAPPSLRFSDDGTYLVVGGLRGLCGSLCMHLARSGAKNLAVISRSGHDDDKSRAIAKQIRALGSHIDLLVADVTDPEQLENAFKQIKKRVAGIIQGAMVLQDRPFEAMTAEEFHRATSCKIKGTWNLHSTAEKLGLRLDFFTLLSSISGVCGTRGQANYAAANTFLDAFASYRRGLGERACSVDLGVVEDAGFIADHAGFRERHFDSRMFKGINDHLLRKIIDISILTQQEIQVNARETDSGLITGLMVPQPADSHLKSDPRFSALFMPSGETRSANTSKSTQGSDLHALLMMLQSPSGFSHDSKLSKTVDVVNKCFVRMLRLADPMDPERPLSAYGIDSLAAVEIRNWVRAELGALVTTMDIMHASSLTGFCKTVMAKIEAKGQDNSKELDDFGKNI